MLDRYVIPAAGNALAPAGKLLAAKGVSADWVMVIGFGLGLVAAMCAALGLYQAAFVLILLNRLLDGIGDATSRAGGVSDFGRYLDIVLTFMVYGAIVLAFGFASADSELPAAILLFCLLGLGGTVLAYTVIAATRGLDGEAPGGPYVDLVSELVGSTETTVVLVLMCLFPDYFAAIALLFALVCLAATVARVMRAWRVFR